MATPSIRNSHVQPNAIRWVEGDTLPTIEENGNAMPLLVDATTGRLKVDALGASAADLTLIHSKLDTSNGIATGTAADAHSIKVQLASGTIAVTGGSGGGAGGGASAAYNATLPTYTSGASSTLQTDINGKLITTGTLTDTQLRASALPVSLASVPSHPVTNAGTFAVQASGGDLTSGSQTTKIVNGANTLAVDSAGAVTANTPASVTYSYTNTGAISASYVLPFGGGNFIDCSQFKELTLHSVAVGTGGNGFTVQVSNDSTNWLTLVNSSGVAGLNAATVFGNTSVGAGFILCYPTYGAKFIRVITGLAITAGTTTAVAQLSQIPSTKTFVSATLTSNQPSPLPSAGLGFALYHNNNSSASVNGTLVKGTAGTIGTLLLTNTTASFKYLLLVNKSTTAPVSGTDSPILSIPIPPNSTIDCSTSFAGVRLGNGIGYYISATNTFTGVSTSSTPTAVAAGDVNVAMSYV